MSWSAPVQAVVVIDTKLRTYNVVATSTATITVSLGDTDGDGVDESIQRMFGLRPDNFSRAYYGTDGGFSPSATTTHTAYSVQNYFDSDTAGSFVATPSSATVETNVPFQQVLSDLPYERITRLEENGFRHWGRSFETLTATWANSPTLPRFHTPGTVRNR